MTTRATSVRREATTLLPPAACLVLLLLLAVRGDAGAAELTRGLAAVLLFQVVPGALIWRAVRPRDGWLVEDLAMGLALGAALAVPTQVLAVATDIPLVPFAVPVVVSAVLLGAPGSRHRIRTRRISALPWWWGAAMLVALIPSALSFVNLLASPVRWRGFAGRYVDMPFHEGLVGELLHRFPLHYPYLAKEEVTYHWFGHAWIADIVALSGTPIDVALWRLGPALIHVAAPVVLAVVTMRITAAAWSGPVAAAVAYVGPVVATAATNAASNPLAPHSPTQEFAVLVLPAALAVVALHLRRELGRAGLLLGIGLLVVAAGAKGTTVSILVPAALLATVAMLVLARDQLRRTALWAAIAVLTLVIMSLTVFRGAGGSLTVDLFGHELVRRGAPLGLEDPAPWTATGLTVLALLLLQYTLPALALLAALLLPTGRRDPVLWLLLGCVLAGVGAIFVFSHPGKGQYYFYKTALVPLGIGTAYGLVLLARSSDRSRRALFVSAAVGGGVALFFALMPVVGEPIVWAAVSYAVLLVAVAAAVLLVGRGHGRSNLALLASTALLAAGVVPTLVRAVEYDRPERPVSATRVAPIWMPYGAVRAYRWLRDHSDEDDLLATNQHCAGATSPRCSRRAFTVSAYSERRVLVEGWAYVPKASALYDPAKGISSADIPYWDPEQLAVNDAFFTDPSAQTRDELAALGVDWVVVVKQAPHARTLEPYAVARYRSRHVDIYELVPDRK